MDMQLKDKVAIVTGASKGLGAAIVEAFVAEGMRVVAAARDVVMLEKLAAGREDLIAVAQCDVSDVAAVTGLVEVARSRFGRLDVVVNNAGIAPAGAFVDMDLDRWYSVFAVNLMAPVALTRAAGQVFLSQGSGKVINVASTSGLRGKPVLAAYSASKGAMLRFSEAVAGEWASSNVQVNVIAPGAFVTDAQQAVTSDPETLRRRIRKIPTGRMGDATEVGALACYLASPLSDFVTGAVYVIDGGESSKL